MYFISVTSNIYKHCLLISKQVPKGLEAEGCVQKLNTVSLRDDKIEDNSKENEDKKVSEPELETEDQIAEMKDTDDKTVDRHSTEEVIVFFPSYY